MSCTIAKFLLGGSSNSWSKTMKVSTWPVRFVLKNCTKRKMTYLHAFYQRWNKTTPFYVQIQTTEYALVCTWRSSTQKIGSHIVCWKVDGNSLSGPEGYFALRVHARKVPQLTVQVRIPSRSCEPPFGAKGQVLWKKFCCFTITCITFCEWDLKFAHKV